MRTADLIDTLARGAGPAPHGLATRRLMPAVLTGIAVSLAIIVALKGGLRLDVQPAPTLVMKLVYTGTLVLAAGWLAARLSRPAVRPGPAAGIIVAIIVLMAFFGLQTLLALPASERLSGFLGQTWSKCPWAVLAMSLPGLAATLWAVRGLAPTRPRAAGAAAGLLAGAGGALGYSFGCPEQAPAFIATWYTSGILLTGAVGALLGPRLLRW